VGPSTKDSAGKIICVHGADDEDGVDVEEELSLLMAVATGEVVTSTVSQEMAQPVWQVGQGP
jgi:hypothetical protein